MASISGFITWDAIWGSHTDNVEIKVEELKKIKFYNPWSKEYEEEEIYIPIVGAIIGFGIRKRNWESELEGFSYLIDGLPKNNSLQITFKHYVNGTLIGKILSVSKTLNDNHDYLDIYIQNIH